MSLMEFLDGFGTVGQSSSSSPPPVDTRQLSEKDQKSVITTFVDLLKVPQVTSARILSEDGQVLNLYSEWTIKDVTKKEGTTFVRNYTVMKSSLVEDRGTPKVYPFTPVPYESKLTCFSPSGSRKAVLTASVSDKGNGGDSKGELLHIYGKDHLLKTYDLKEIGKHKNVYTSGGAYGNTMCWSKSETKLAYLAEKKPRKTKPFFSTPGETAEKEEKNQTNSKEPDVGPDVDVPVEGQEYSFKQSWGEQNTDAFESVIVVLDLDMDELQILPLPDNIFPSDIQWVNNSMLIGTAYDTTQWRLGLLYCTNKNSKIFIVNADGNEVPSSMLFLSDGKRAAFSPRVRPDCEFVIWQERDLDEPHDKVREIMGLQINEEILIPQLIYSAQPENKIPIYSDFQRACWTPDGSKFYVCTPNETEGVILQFEFKKGTLAVSKKEPIRGVNALLHVENTWLLTSQSTMVKTPALVLVDTDTASKPRKFNITESRNVIPHPTKRLTVPGSVSPASFYYGPAGDLKGQSVPLIATPHGGPNSSYIDGFVPEMALFLSFGYGILRLNYIGSTGGHSDTTNQLSGKAGSLDVKDCQNSVETLLKMEPALNPDTVGVFGFSHGGFLGAHLTSAYPGFYKTAVLGNPVIDLVSMLSTTDITDWCYAQAGVQYDSKTWPSVRNPEEAQKFINCSPIKDVMKVKTPTLLLLGTEDKRVPPTQGFAYYRALKALNIETDARVYNDCHPLFKVPNRFDSGLHTFFWISKYLRK